MLSLHFILVCAFSAGKGKLMKKLTLSIFIIILFFLNGFQINAVEKPNSNIKSVDVNENNTASDESFSKDEIYKMLIESKEEKIDLLQGNISNVISFFSVIIAIIALLATVFGFVLNNRFTKRYQEVNDIKKEIETDKDQIKKQINDINQLESHLKDIKEELNKEQKKLKEKQSEFTSYLDWIESTSIFLNYLEIKDYRELCFIKFLYLKPFAVNKMKEIESLFKENPILMQKMAGSESATEETLYDEYKYLEKNLLEEETNLVNHINSDVTFENVVEAEEGQKLRISYSEEAESSFEDWYSYYEDLLLLYDKLK